MQRDKLLHFAGGFAIALVLGLLGVPDVIALLAVLIAAAGKELWDSTGRGTPEHWDAIYTIAGGVIALPLT